MTKTDLLSHYLIQACYDYDWMDESPSLEAYVDYLLSKVTLDRLTLVLQDPKSDYTSVLDLLYPTPPPMEQ